MLRRAGIPVGSGEVLLAMTAVESIGIERVGDLREGTCGDAPASARRPRPVRCGICRRAARIRYRALPRIRRCRRHDPPPPAISASPPRWLCAAPTPDSRSRDARRRRFAPHPIWKPCATVTSSKCRPRKREPLSTSCAGPRTGGAGRRAAGRRAHGATISTCGARCANWRAGRTRRFGTGASGRIGRHGW